MADSNLPPRLFRRVYVSWGMVSWRILNRPHPHDRNDIYPLIPDVIETCMFQDIDQQLLACIVQGVAIWNSEVQAPCRKDSPVN
jgi:hypothetical protein